MLKIYLHMLPKLRLNGVMSLLFLYVFLTWTGTTLPVPLTLNLLTTTIVAPPSNASKLQMGFNSAFKGLILIYVGTKTNKRSVDVTKSACWLRDIKFSRGLRFSQLCC
jgi:hypothetical protein